MSSTVNQAIKDIKVLSSLTKGLRALSDELDAVGGLEKLEREKQQRVDALSKEADGIQAKIDACTAECVRRSREADKLKADAFAYVEAEYETARKERAAAEVEIADMKAQAAAEIEAAKTDAGKDITAARQVKQEIDGQIQAARENLAALNAAADEAIARRDAANAELERLQNLFAPKP